MATGPRAVCKSLGLGAVALAVRLHVGGGEGSNHLAAELSHFDVETVRHCAQGATRGHCFPEKIGTSKKLQLLAGGSSLVFTWGMTSLQGNPQDLFCGLCNHVIGNTYEQNCSDHMQF